jgi:galactoside O-acetyltransferase
MSDNSQLHNESLYMPNDPELEKQQFAYMDQLYDFNQTRPSEMDKRQTLLKRMFAEIGSNCYVEPPLNSNWGGHHVHFGDGVYANYNLTLVDDTHIFVGDHTLFGPNVTLASAGHPINPELREQGYQYNAPIHIGKNCWLGAGVIVVPGINIGDNVVIGAGSIVTKDLPDNVIAVGNPAKVLRQVGQHDREYYFKNHQINPAIFD